MFIILVISHSQEEKKTADFAKRKKYGLFDLPFYPYLTFSSPPTSVPLSLSTQITPPWVPEVASSSDLKYMGMEDPADQEQLRLTPPPPSFDTDFPSVPRRYPVF